MVPLNKEFIRDPISETFSKEYFVNQIIYEGVNLNTDLAVLRGRRSNYILDMNNIIARAIRRPNGRH